MKYPLLITIDEMLSLSGFATVSSNCVGKCMKNTFKLKT